METEHIREFLVLAQLESFAAAADELYIAQPTLTKHMKALETELGQQLFDRTTRRVKLNRLGRAFLPFAERITESCSDARETLCKLSRDGNSTLNLGVLPSFVTYNIPEYLIRFKSLYPEDSITLREGTNEELLRWLLEGRCNLAFVRHFEDEPDPRFATLPLVQDSLVVVVPFGHPLDDGRTSIHINELQGRELLMSTSITEERMLQNHCEKTGVKLKVTSRLSLGRPDVVVGMLEQGFGPAILMRHPARHSYADKLRILELEPKTSTTVSLVYAKNEPLNTAARNLIKIVFQEELGQ